MAWLVWSSDQPRRLSPFRVVGAAVTGFDISTGDSMEDGWPDEKPGAASLGAASEFHQ